MPHTDSYLGAVLTCKMFTEPMKLLRQARAASWGLSCPDLADGITNNTDNTLQKHKKEDAQ